MPFFAFEAVDATGKAISGTLQAANAQELEKMLGQRGMRLKSIGGNPAPQSQPVQTPRRPMQQARPVTQAVRSVPATSSAQPVARVETSRVEGTPVKPTAVAPNTTVPSPELSTKELYFIFSQFASFVKSGFSSSQMIQHVGARATGAKRIMFDEMQAETQSGMALSETMRRRPNSFPPDMVAVMKAGEESGAMEEACVNISEQIKRGRSFAFTMNYFAIMTPLLLLCGIGGIGLQKASQATIKRQFDADGSLPQVGTLMEEVRKQMTQDILLGFLAAVLFIVLWRIWFKNPCRKARHALGVALPLGGSRGKSEAVERFSWTMSTMLKGGASPASAAMTAAESIPNLVLRQRAIDSMGVPQEHETLGMLMQRSGVMSSEYVHIAENGEMTGNTPAALNSIVEAESAQVHSKSSGLNIVGHILGLIIVGTFTIIMVATLYKMYAGGIIKLMMEQ